MDEAEEIQENQEAPAQASEPAKRGRGRPPGSRNKVRISVEPPEAQEPSEPVAMKPRARQAPAPVVSEQTPHETFRAAMAAWQQMAQSDRQAKKDHYHRLVAGALR
jgi:hypothetical protein